MFNGKQLTQIEADLMRVSSQLAALRNWIEFKNEAVDRIETKLESALHENTVWMKGVVDSLVEFTLAAGPEPASAAMHRAQVRLQEKREQETPVAPEVGEQWPPPNHDVLCSRG